MLKMTLKSFYVICLVITTGIAGAALVTKKHPPPPAEPAYCKEGGRWLSIGSGAPRFDVGPQIISNAARQDVVLLGEQHDIEDHHRWQLQMLAALHAQRPNMVIGFEMFPRRVQPVLDKWVAGSLTAQEFLQQAEWDKVWSFAPQIYMPLFEFARINKIPMLALNIDKSLTQKIADNGWDKVPEAQREGIGRPAPALPEYEKFLGEVYQMHLQQSKAHAAKKAAAPDNSFRFFVESQLAWDRAMAETISRSIRPEGSKNSTLVVGIMGSGHIRFGHGVPHQLRHLGITKVATLLPVAQDGECQYLEAGVADAAFTLPSKATPPVEPPRLGVALEDAAQGLRISSVTAGSLAEKSGLKAGDRFLEIAGRPAGSSGEAISIIRRQPPGTWLPLRITRDDKQLDLVIQFPVKP